MEATLERQPRQNSNTDITNGGNIVVHSIQEGKASPSNGSHMVSDQTGGTKMMYGTSSRGGDNSLTSDIVNVRLQKRVETNDHVKMRILARKKDKDDLGSSSENGTVQAKHRIVKLTDLEGVFEKTAAEKFYCPKCSACITEVLIGESEPKFPPPPIPSQELPPSPRPSSQPGHLEERVRCISCFSLLGDWLFRRRPVPAEEVRVPVDDPPLPAVQARDVNNRSLEIIKSIVYGGLTEAIAIVSIVASAASADTATPNIFVLALANLLGGLFIIGHNLWEMKANEADTNKYQEVLGNKENFIFHAPVAILCFLIFGLVPPLVYGFSFPNSDDSDLKIAVVAGASLVCIIVLAIGKAYIKTPPKEYLKTVLYYVVVGVGCSGVSYLAGDLIGKLVEKLGWFSSTVAAGQTMMSTVKPAWESW